MKINEMYLIGKHFMLITIGFMITSCDVFDLGTNAVIPASFYFTDDEGNDDTSEIWIISSDWNFSNNMYKIKSYNIDWKSLESYYSNRQIYDGRIRIKNGKIESVVILKEGYAHYGKNVKKEVNKLFLLKFGGSVVDVNIIEGPYKGIDIFSSGFVSFILKFYEGKSFYAVVDRSTSIPSIEAVDILP